MKKNTLKGWIPTVGLVAVLTFGATFANAGVVVNTAPATNLCTDASKTGVVVNTGSANTCTDTSKTGVVVNTSPIFAAILAAITGLIVSD